MKNIVLFIIAIGLLSPIRPQLNNTSIYKLAGVEAGFTNGELQAMLGFRFGLISTNNFGGYLGFKFNPNLAEPEHVYNNISNNYAKYKLKNWENDFKYKYLFFSIGAIKCVDSGKVFLLGGISYQYSKTFIGFFDNSHVLGDYGNYYCAPSENHSIAIDASIMIILMDRTALSLNTSFGHVNTYAFGCNWMW